MHLYRSSYGADTHSPHPEFHMRGNEIYSTIHNPTEGPRSLPWYEVRGDKIYSTAHNPGGHSLQPMYEIRGKEVYTTIHNPEHSHLPVFHLRS